MTGIITKLVKIIGSETEPETINAQVNINMQSGGHPYKEVELAVQQAQREFIRRLVKPVCISQRIRPGCLKASESPLYRNAPPNWCA